MLAEQGNGPYPTINTPKITINKKTSEIKIEDPRIHTNMPPSQQLYADGLHNLSSSSKTLFQLTLTAVYLRYATLATPGMTYATKRLLSTLKDAI